MRPFTAETVASGVVRGQYAPGEMGGRPLPGYRQESGVDRNSATETFAAARLYIDNWRWADVPFYIRTGKRLARSVTEIAIQFRRPPHLVFRGQDLDPNALVLNVQPEEGISIRFHAKFPGADMRLKDVAMDFSYRSEFGGRQSAYATLLNDCMRGDATLFDRADGMEAAWALVDPILQAWRDRTAPVPTYAAGTWGPRESDELLERDGRRWRQP
jgi:glucose-6-phosphate 1-dehydrogenase